jgi:hypothetical protein
VFNVTFDMKTYQKKYQAQKQACFEAFRWIRENDPDFAGTIYQKLPAKLQATLDDAFPEDD